MWSLPNFRLSRFASCCLLTALLGLISAGSAAAQEAYRLTDSGKVRDLVVAPDEIHVIISGVAPSDLKARIEAAVPGTTAAEVNKGQTLLKVPARSSSREGEATAAAISRAIPGAEVEAVLYPPAAVRDRMNRRIATADVLVQVPAGETAGSLAASAGATAAKPTTIGDRVMLHFASGFHALEAAKNLQARGVTVNVELRRQHALRSIPNDPYFPNQWHLQNTGQGGGVVGVDANVTDAWDITTGTDINTGTPVTICVVDESLQTTHPDLTANCPSLSTNFHHDFNGGDNDPAPVNGIGSDGYNHDDKHGTSVGGVAAGKGNNGIGISGSAPDAQLVGIRLISGPSTDSEDAQALYWTGFGPAKGTLTVGVCNNSWGPTVYYTGPDILAKQALQDAATLGRGGKGQITLFAGGNSQRAVDGSRDSNADSFANSRFVIGVGASDNFGGQCTYSQRGANLLVCAPSSDPFNPQPRLGIWTTDDIGGLGYNPGAGEPSDQNYTNSFGGTSSATPLVSGCVALMVAANPNLGWRDVHEIVAATAVQLQPSDPDWVVNGGGFKFNHKFGGGMINATAAVVCGLDWNNLAAEQNQTKTPTASLPVAIPDNNATGVSRNFDFSAGPNLRVERVELAIHITHNHRSDLEITLTSPSGTKSIFSELRPQPTPGDYYDDDVNVEDSGQPWTFTTTHSWGENSTGTWKLTVKDLRSGTSGTIDSATVKIYGTTAPLERVTFAQPLYSVAENAGSQTIRVNRLGPTTDTISVDLITSTHGTATAGSDFDAVSTNLTFGPGVTYQDVPITIRDDLNPEPPETIYAILKNPSGTALGGTPLTTVKIIDDETRPVTIVATDPDASETNTGETADTGTFTITRAAADPTPLIVNLQIGGTATGGTDYSTTPAQPTSVTIQPYQLSTTLTVTPMNDSTIEGTETVDVTVLPGFGYDVGVPSMATVLIHDNDKPQVNITTDANSVAESSLTPVNFIVSRGVADPQNSLIVKLTVEGTAKPGDNYIELPTQVEIPAGSASVMVPLQPINDTIYISLKTVVLRLAQSPDYKEGFNTSATIRITEDDPLPDVKSPTVKITSPASKARINVPNAVTATGTAADNLGVTRVVYSVNGGPLRLATGTTTWTADITAELKPGSNTLTVYSQDKDGNLSKPAIVTFDYVHPQPLTVDIMTNGATDASGGTVSKLTPPPKPGAQPEAGQTYLISAKPNTGFVFAGWSGDLADPRRDFRFVMPDAPTHLVANFVTDPYTATSQFVGTYTGEIRTPGFAYESCGMLQVTINAKGSCTGKLYLATATPLSFTSEFNGQGVLKTQVKRTVGGPLNLDLTVALGGTDRVVTGTVASPDFTATVAGAQRAGFSKTALYPLLNSHPKGETYTFQILVPASPALLEPHGCGFGRFSVDSLGYFKWTATLRDGLKTSGAVPLDKNKSAVLYANLPYKKKGLILGNMAIDKTQTIPAVNGAFDWLKPAESKETYFPSGFTLLNETASGCLYTPPPTKTPAHSAFGYGSSGTGTVTLDKGNLDNQEEHPPAPFTRNITVGTDNKAVVQETPLPAPQLGIVVKVDAVNGTFSGSFYDPKFGFKQTSLKFEGVILQDTAAGIGNFPGKSTSGTALQTGSVTIDLQ